MSNVDVQWKSIDHDAKQSSKKIISTFYLNSQLSRIALVGIKYNISSVILYLGNQEEIFKRIIL